MDNSGPVYICIFLVLLLIDICIYGFQAAVYSLDERILEVRNTEDKKVSYISRMLDNDARMSQLTSIAVTLNHILMGAIMIPFLMKKGTTLLNNFLKGSLWENKKLGMSMLHIILLLIVMFVLLYIVNIFGILLPRKLASRQPEKWAFRCVGFVAFMDKLFQPISKITSVTTDGILSLLRVNKEAALDDIFEREIIDMVNEGHEQGAIEANEVEMIHKIFEYGDKEAQDIMTNRSNIVAIDKELSLEEALQYMLAGKNSRYPVFEESIDHIVGILYLKDAMRYYNSGINVKEAIGNIQGLLRKAEFTPLTRKIDDLFETLQAKKLQMTIIIDEYGQTAGLVTIEDILEEIFGKIQDEYDEDEEFIEETSNDAYVMEGLTPLQDIEEQLGIEFGDTEYETLNGYIIGLMDHIPEEDEDFEFRVEEYNFKVLSIDNMRVQSVLVEKLAKEPKKETEQQKEN